MENRICGYLSKNYSSFLLFLINLGIALFGPFYLAFAGVILFGALFYPQWRAKFDLFYAETEENKKIIEKCPTIKNVKDF